MTRIVRDGTGLVVVLSALGVIFHGIRKLGGGDYLASIILVLAGLSLMRAGAELLRPAVGE